MGFIVCNVTDNETHGLLNPWKNLIHNRDLGEDLHDCPVEVALQVVRVETFHGKCLSLG